MRVKYLLNFVALFFMVCTSATFASAGCKGDGSSVCQINLYNACSSQAAVNFTVDSPSGTSLGTAKNGVWLYKTCCLTSQSLFGTLNGIPYQSKNTYTNTGSNQLVTVIFPDDFGNVPSGCKSYEDLTQ